MDPGLLLYRPDGQYKHDLKKFCCPPSEYRPAGQVAHVNTEGLRVYDRDAITAAIIATQAQEGVCGGGRRLVSKQWAYVSQGNDKSEIDHEQ